MDLYKLRLIADKESWDKKMSSVVEQGSSRLSLNSVLMILACHFTTSDNLHRMTSNARVRRSQSEPFHRSSRKAEAEHLQKPMIAIYFLSINIFILGLASFLHQYSSSFDAYHESAPEFFISFIHFDVL